MRAFGTALLLLLTVSQARAADLQVWCPALVHEAMEDFAHAFTERTGTHVTITTRPMGQMVESILAGSADIVILPPDLMTSLERQGGVKAGTRTALARVEIGLAVREGAAKPDISTVERFGAALRQAQSVTYSKPGPPRFSREADIIDALLKRKEFAGVHADPAPSGSGVAWLAGGHADMAMQVVPEILATKGITLVGALPPSLDAHINVEAGLSPRAGDGAQDFVRYVSGPGAAHIWKEQGVDRN